MFKPYLCNSTQLFPVNLGDFIPEGSPVRLVSSIVERLDLSRLLESYSRHGAAGYHPRMLLKVVLFGYMNNIYSLRALEEAIKRDTHLMWLSCYQFPDHSTLSRFKTVCASHIKDIFTRLVRILVEMGEVSLGEDLYIDGTTIRSRAGRRRIKWRSNSQRFASLAQEKIRQGIRELLEQIDHPQQEESLPRVCNDYTVEDALRIAREIEERSQGKKIKGLRGKISKLRQACEKRQEYDRTLQACGHRCGLCPTDPQCGLMHAKEDGYNTPPTPNYNVQSATQNQYVTNFDLFPTPSDKETAIDFVDTCIKENAVAPRAIVADAGYGYEQVYVGLEKRQIQALIKYPGYDRQRRAPKPGEGDFDPDAFKLSQCGTTLICPQGHAMERVGIEQAYTPSGFRSDSSVLTCRHLRECPHKERCPLSRNKDGKIKRKLGHIRQQEKAWARLHTRENQEKLKRRAIEVEPVFGTLKAGKGYTRFRHFGKIKVTMDLGFVFMAMNIKKLYRNLKKAA